MEDLKLDLQRKREALIKQITTIDRYLDTVSTKIKDSESVSRDILHAEDNYVVAIGKGGHGDTVDVEANEFEVDVLLLDGSVKMEVEGEDEVILNDKNKHLFIPNNSNFKMTGIGRKNSVIQVTKHKP